ncbi:hypothetical protein [Marinomonas pontica]
MRVWLGFWRVVGSSDGLNHLYGIDDGYNGDAFYYEKGLGCIVHNQFFI